MLLPADPLHPTRPDPAFAAEAGAASHVLLLDHEALLRGEFEAALRRIPRDAGPHWYRGWMIPTGVYTDLARALAERGTPLIVNPTDYRRAHELPGWFAVFAHLTPATAWSADASAPTPPPSDGAFVVKDWVKSRKHEWAKACFAPTPEAVPAIAREMVRLAGDAFAGGVVVRAFERFEGREVRIFWLDGAPILSVAHPDDPGPIVAPPLDEIARAVRALGCRFVTTDVVRRTDGMWRVVEVGDGQVSDVGKEAVAAASLARALDAAAGQ
jgi:hypothetical protein